MSPGLHVSCVPRLFLTFLGDAPVYYAPPFLGVLPEREIRFILADASKCTSHQCSALPSAPVFAIHSPDSCLRCPRQ